MLWRIGVKMDHAKSIVIGTAFWKKEKKIVGNKIKEMLSREGRVDVKILFLVYVLNFLVSSNYRVILIL